MAFYADHSGRIPQLNTQTASDARLPLSRRGRVLQDSESPRSSGPVSLEDYIVQRSTNRNRSNREAKPNDGTTRLQESDKQVALLAAHSAHSMPGSASSVPPQRVQVDKQLIAPCEQESVDGQRTQERMRAEATPLNSGTFKQLHHSNGDLTMAQWSDGDEKWISIGRISQNDVSYFLRFCERSILDNQHDAQKMELYREHIITMAKCLAEKRNLSLQNAEQSAKPVIVAQSLVASTCVEPRSCRHTSKSTSDSSQLGEVYARESTVKSASNVMSRPFLGSLHEVQPRVSTGFLPTQSRVTFATFEPSQVDSSFLTAAAQGSHRERNYREHRGSQLHEVMAPPDPLQSTIRKPASTAEDSAACNDQVLPLLSKSYDFHRLAPENFYYKGSSSFQRAPEAPRPFSPSVAVSRSSFAKMPTTFQEFFPQLRSKVRHISITMDKPYTAPKDYKHLLEDSTPVTLKDERPVARGKYEKANAITRSAMAETELRAASSHGLRSNEPLRTVLHPGQAWEEDPGTLQTLNVREQKAKHLAELETWWNSGRQPFVDMENGWCKGQIVIADNATEAAVGIPIMSAVLSSLWSYSIGKVKQEHSSVGYFIQFSTTPTRGTSIQLMSQDDSKASRSRPSAKMPTEAKAFIALDGKDGQGGVTFPYGTNIGSSLKMGRFS